MGMDANIKGDAVETKSETDDLCMALDKLDCRVCELEYGPCDCEAEG
jgi:hypothetical protein